MGSMKEHVTQAQSFCWPTPPFYRRDAQAPKGVARLCRVEYLDGTIAAGELVAFTPRSGIVTLKPSGEKTARAIDLARIRVIRRVDPIALSADASALRGIGAKESKVIEDKNFTVYFTDGAELTGRTRGWIKESFGLFLFVIEREGDLASRYFVPAQALRDAKIGPLLGEVLTANKLISAATLTAALARQTALRGEPLGQILNDRALVSRDELEQSLRKLKRRPNVRLGQVLLGVGLITQEQLDMALAAQQDKRRRPLGEILIDLGAVSRTQVQTALADKLGIPIVDVRKFKIDPSALQLVPGPTAFRHQALPLLRLDNSLVVAAEDPLALDTNELRFATGLEILAVMADGNELKTRIAKEYGDLDAGAIIADYEVMNSGVKDPLRRADSSQVTLGDLTSQLADEAPESSERSQNAESEALVSDSAMVKLVNKIIIDAYEQGASDIHIESNPGRRPTRIRFRKDGVLQSYLELEPAYRSNLVSRVKIMANLDISERRHAQDGKIEFGRFGPLRIELRVAIIPTTNGLEDVVLRILGGSEPIAIDKLGLSERNLAEIKKMVARTFGLVLVCGPTGSGKTTTLHSLLSYINHPEIKIWTAEDPIEITQPGLRQVQIHAKIGWTFATAMRALLRSDPDVIMVGEMRDQETAKIGIEASLTGHLVFSTLHTNSAAESIVRLLDIGLDQFTFADALIGILGQRLAQRLCPQCKKPHPATEAEIAELVSEYCLGTQLDHAAVVDEWNRILGRDGTLILHERVGCEHCNKGYAGRVGIHELIVANPAIKRLIHARAPVPELVESAQREGTLLLRQDAIEKVLQGHLDLASARAVYC
jgi:type II secretory ATPase GspE/PulE/Tfp pilus assembly ATPase PilB-like protein